MLYEHLDGLRDRTSERLAQALRQTGGTPQARTERDVLVAMYTQRLAQLDAAENGLCFGRIDSDGGEQHYIGRLGIRDEVLSMLGTGRMSSGVAAVKARKMDSGDDSPDFALEWAVKDIGLALDAAPDRRLTVLDALRNRWQELVEQGLGGLDMSAARHGLDAAALPPH